MSSHKKPDDPIAVTVVPPATGPVEKTIDKESGHVVDVRAPGTPFTTKEILAKRPVKPEFKGKKTYRITAPHYRHGKMWNAGDIITVEDEVPSKTWILLDKKELGELDKKQLAATVAEPISRPPDQEF